MEYTKSKSEVPAEEMTESTEEEMYCMHCHHCQEREEMAEGEHKENTKGLRESDKLPMFRKTRKGLKYIGKN